ncbi:PorT family protein [Reichenbachiella ulvae]|uniref:PorT family protein n=1 Tax=Reichenbachiella ulvae TaxID=2980104 RepID=A0ABT3CQ79_9BACT|nr:PorT family protein [Reichenbachiella ulvae]MCV9385726.1 PorT family protein [Reichenbachiella ulvae]
MRIPVLLLIIGLCGGSCLGQRANVGVKGGVNIQNAFFDFSSISNNYHVGPVFKYDASKRTSFSVEGLYSTQTWKGYEKGLSTESIQVPVVMKYFIKKPIYIQGGAQGSVLLNKKDDAGKLPLENNEISYAYLGGVGIGLPSGFDLSLRYLHPVEQTQFNTSLLQVSLAFDIY